MNDNAQDSPTPAQATVRRERSVSLFWLFPLVAALVAAWLAWQAYTTRGTEITIQFNRGEGLAAGTTVIRYKAVEVGQVEQVSIARDLRSIEVKARINLDFSPHLSTNTRFWIVRPRIGARGISGLGTLVSGAYIEVDPAPGPAANRFVGLEVPPIIASDAPGASYVLKAAGIGGVNPGSSVYFKDVEVGEVLGYELAADGAEVSIHVFVRDPYTQFVRENSRFWLSHGFGFSLSADGLEVKTGSLQEVLLGGINFDSPAGPDTAAAASGSTFALFPDFDSIAEAGITNSVRYIMYFDESVRGLRVGAPVEYRGIKLGEVAEIGLEIQGARLNPYIPVVVGLQPQRLGAHSSERQAEAATAIESLIKNGLKASLETGNLLTGQLFIELLLNENAPAKFVAGKRDLPQIPTLPTEFGEFRKNVTALLAELREFPLGEIGDRMSTALAAVERTVSDPEIARTITAAKSSFESFENLNTAFEKEILPIGDSLRASLAGLKPTAPIYSRIEATLHQIELAARAFRQLSETIERNPESAVWGKPDNDN